MAIASYAPEVMTEPLPETQTGHVQGVASGDSSSAKMSPQSGPAWAATRIRRVYPPLRRDHGTPMVVDADGAQCDRRQQHPAERPPSLHAASGRNGTADGQEHRRKCKRTGSGIARGFAQEHGVLLSVEREPDGDRFPGRASLDQPDRLAFHGDRRDRGCPHRICWPG